MKIKLPIIHSTLRLWTISLLLLLPGSGIVAQESVFSDEELDQFAHAVVYLLVETLDNTSVQGSGVLVSRDGYIFTAAHVVENAVNIRIGMFESEGQPITLAYTGRISEISDMLDFAVVQIVADENGQPLNDIATLNLPAITQWNGEIPTRTEQIYIWGYPIITSGLSTTSGIITDVEITREGLYLETDAVFVNGISGGLVINQAGEFIGLPVSFRTAQDGTGQFTFILALSTICEMGSACELLPLQTATQLSDLPPNAVSGEQLDSIFGAGNWFCFPDRNNGIAARTLPVDDYVVQFPVLSIDTYLGTSTQGELAPCCISATINLSGSVPRSECPPSQQAALRDWQLARARATPVLDRVALDTIFIPGTWACLNDYDFAVLGTLASDLAVIYPVLVVNSPTGTYGVGETVAAGTSATLWFAATIPRNQCSF